MSDLHLNFSARPNEQPGDDDAREARHQVLATLLGAYADGELPAETSSQIDAHLLGCARCRREVQMHAAVRERLSHEPAILASAALRARIMLQLAASSPGVATTTNTVRSDVAWWRSSRAQFAAASALVLSSALFGIERLRTPLAPRTAPIATVSAATVPLFTQVLDDYRRVTSGDLPGRARDLDAVRAAVPFPVQPMQGPAVRLLAAWNTDLVGEPAAVLAYRWGDRLVLEYLIAEPTFFRHPGMRAPLAAGRMIAASSGGQGLVAWAAPESGAVLVGDVAPSELAALRAGGVAR